MKRVSWCVVGAVLAVGVGCGGNNQTRDAGSAGGSAFTGGGSSGVGGGFSATGGGSVTGGGRTAGGSATGGGAAGGAAVGGGSVLGGGTGGSGGGSTEFDGGGLVGGETCTNAVAVAGNTISVTSTTTGLVSDYAYRTADMGCENVSTGTTAPDVVYAVPVAAGDSITASVTTTWDAVINLVVAPSDNCGDAVDGGTAGAVTCVAGADVATAGTDTAQWLNDTGSAVTVFVVIDGYDDGEEGDFSLNIAVGPPPPGDTCATALAVSVAADAGVSLPAETLTGFASDFASAGSTGCAFSSGADRVYSFSIPPGLRLTARAVSSQNITLNVIDDLALCTASPVQCSVNANNAFTGMMQTEILTLDNSSTMPRPVLLVVDSSSGATTFSLDLSVGTVPAGDSCTTAIAVTSADAGTTLPTETLAGFASDFGSANGCEFAFGPDRVYSTTVPANARLTVTVVSGDNLSISAVPDVAACGASSVMCPAAVDQVFSGASQTETLFLDNSTATPRPVLLVVDSVVAAPMSPFSLALSAGPIPPGDSCVLPEVVTVADGGVTLPAQPFTGFASDYGFSTNSMGCSFGTGADRVYQVAVPPNQRLTATATTPGDIAVNIVRDVTTCRVDPLVCLAAGDRGFGGSMAMPEIETAKFDNTTMAAQNLIVIVDSHSATTPAFDLALNVGPIPPPPYTVAMMSGACDTFTTVTPTPLLSDSTTPPLADDEFSDTAALPFTFSYFGTPVTHFSVSSNGFMQLFTSSSDFGTSSASNDPIPTEGEPEGIVAPFWDDLDLVSSTTSKIVGGVFGTGSARHYTVQWEDMKIYNVTGSSITVQARLYETTNVIELHACTLTAGTSMADMDRERGLEATVGIESVDGLEGVQHTYNQANVTAGQVIRYTP